MRAREAAVALALVCAAALSVAALCVGTGQKPGERDARTLRGTSSAEVGDGVEERLTDLGFSHQREEHESSEGVEGAASALLEERRAQGGCVVVRSGYLDLLGRTWACVLQGSGWVEICLVSERDEGRGSEVVTWRMEASELGSLAAE